MNDDEIISRLMTLRSDIGVNFATRFLELYREMQVIDREIAEQDRVEQARKMTERSRC